MNVHRTVGLVSGVALVAGLLTIPTASPVFAATLTVDATGSGADANPGNGVCATAGGQCTLQAAVEEANATNSSDIINVPAGTYTVTGRLVVTGDTTIRGAGADTTVITGADSAPLFRISTQEYLICDSVNDRIRSYDVNGVLNGTWVAAGTGGLDTPISAHIGRDDDVFVSGFSSGVHRFDGATGADEGLFVAPGSGGLLGPTDAVFGPSNSGTVFSDNLHVTKYQPDGAILRYNGGTGASMGTFVATGSGSLGTPNSIVFRGGSLYTTSVTANAVKKYNGTTGAFQATFVSSFSGGLSTPRDLIFAPDGSLLVASWDTDSVLRYNGTTGAFLGTLVSAGSGGLDRPTDLAIGHDGSLLVISQGTKQVLRYNVTTGAFRGVLVTGGTASLQQPSCILPRQGVGSGPTVSISKVTLSHGATEVADAGAALLTDRGSTTSVSDTIIRDHSSSTFGGAISNWGRLTLTRTEVRDNSLPEGGGGQTSQGGGIFNTGQLTLNRSAVTGNEATRGGGISNTNFGSVDIRNSTISGNTALGGGGGLRNVANGTMRISLSTIADNEANVPGKASGEANRFGGGIQTLNPAAISIGGSVVANNTDNRSSFDSDFAPDCYAPTVGTFTSHRYNVLGVKNSNCALRDVISGSDTSHDQKGTGGSPLDPHLGVLTNNGGPTRTHALNTGSPAIDYKSAGSGTTFFDCLASDQRSYSRPADGDGNGSSICDSGACERNGSPPLAIFLPPWVIDLLTPILCPPNGGFCIPLTDLTKRQLTLASVLSPEQLQLLAAVPPDQLNDLVNLSPQDLRQRFQLTRDQYRLLLRALRELQPPSQT